MTQRAPETQGAPRALIYTNLIAVQRAKHERMLRQLGFEPESRDFPNREPAFLDPSWYAVVLAVNEHATSPADVLKVKNGASKSGVRFFAVQKNEASPGWNQFREWSATLGLRPIREVDDAPPTGEVPAIEVRVESADVEKLRKECETWQTLAKDEEEKYLQAERELKEAKRERDELRGELRKVFDVSEAARRNSVAWRGDVERLQSEVKVLKEERTRAHAARDASAKHLHEVQAELKDARQRVVMTKPDDESAGRIKSLETMLHKARKERDDLQDFVKEMQEEGASQRTLDLVEWLRKGIEVGTLTADEAFEKLAKEVCCG